MDRERIARLLGSDPVAWRPVTGGGYSLIERGVVTLADGSTAFVKRAVNDDTAGFLRDEYRIYSDVEAGFLPRLLGFDDDGERPLLAIEDLSGEHWPPPWRPGDVEAVCDALAQVAATAPPAGLAGAETLLDELALWPQVAADPAPLLSLGLCDAAWLERHLDELTAAAAAAPLAGDALLHLDVRSDNLCLRDGAAVLVDWNWAVVGNPLVDLAGWASSLTSEGGPPPETVAPDAPELASLLAGFFCAQAGLPAPAFAPRVREVQLSQARVALPWAARALGIEEPTAG